MYIDAVASVCDVLVNFVRTTTSERFGLLVKSPGSVFLSFPRITHLLLYLHTT